MARRTAAPASSGAVRRSSPAPAPARSVAPASTPLPPRTVAAPTPSAPVHAPTHTAPPMAAAPVASQGPSMMQQMAATAGGVAIGSVVGSAVGNMFSSSSSTPAPAAAPAPVNNQQSYQGNNVCDFEYQRLVDCSRNTSDIASCNAFQDLFKECKLRNNF
uniref:CHCH domain-containing protein n=1 Tax=Rhabditophanes sp. KR3021 TaxID=114890 RepID=A0AC35U5I8_9BILA